MDPNTYRNPYYCNLKLVPLILGNAHVRRKVRPEEVVFYRSRSSKRLCPTGGNASIITVRTVIPLIVRVVRIVIVRIVSIVVMLRLGMCRTS